MAAASNAVPFVCLFPAFTLRLSTERDYGDLTRLVDFNARDTHTCGDNSLDGSRHVLLPKCGRRADHGSYRETGLSAVIEACPRSNPHTSKTASARSRPSAMQQIAPAASMAEMVASCSSLGRLPGALSSTP